MVFFEERINMYTINGFTHYSDDEVCLQLFSYEKFEEEELIKIIENTCKILCNSKEYDDDDREDLLFDAYNHLIKHDDRFFEMKAIHAIEINTMCCEHLYKVKSARSCCPSNK